MKKTNTPEYNDEEDFLVEAINEGNSIRITGCKRKLRVIRIPLFIQNLPVTEIGDNAFFFIKLTNVTIPDGITKIGKGAFFFNRLTSVNIPQGVTCIAERAFKNN